MGESLKFNSQVCTSIEQSQHLLDLGLKPETADMVLIKELAYDTVAHCTYDADTYMIRTIDYLEGERHRGHIPAWSLHRLLEMYVERYISCNVNLKELTFDWLIDEIGTHITENDFNKKYLK